MTEQRSRPRHRPTAGGCRRRWALLTAALGIAAAATLGGAASVSASRAAAGSCVPISPAQLRTVLGLASSLQMRNTASHSGDSINHECNAVAWTGPVPTSPQAALQLGRSGHGAQVGIQTWRPNESSSNVQQWKDKDYAKLTGGFTKEASTFPGLFTNAGWPAKRVTPSSFGYQTGGFVVQVQGLGKGLVAAAGCWWHDKTYSAVCILDEEAASKPVVRHLNQLAKIAVAQVLG
jgi:hypothetical protein